MLKLIPIGPKPRDYVQIFNGKVCEGTVMAQWAEVVAEAIQKQMDADANRNHTTAVDAAQQEK